MQAGDSASSSGDDMIVYVCCSSGVLRKVQTALGIPPRSVAPPTPALGSAPHGGRQSPVVPGGSPRSSSPPGSSLPQPQQQQQQQQRAQSPANGASGSASNSGSSVDDDSVLCPDIDAGTVIAGVVVSPHDTIHTLRSKALGRVVQEAAACLVSVQSAPYLCEKGHPTTCSILTPHCPPSTKYSPLSHLSFVRLVLTLQPGSTSTTGSTELRG